MTPIFLHHIEAIDMFQISQVFGFFFKKRVLNQNCGFFQHFLAPFETFTILHHDPCIKFDHLDNFDL